MLYEVITVVAAEYMLIHVLRRAKELAQKGEELFASPALKFFLANNIKKSDFQNDKSVLEQFARLDDFDILGAVKVWVDHPDKVLSELSKRLINRDLFKIFIRKEPIQETEIAA